ncbi:RNA-binding S4 domain-containing protein [Magnetovibrio sp.]|uniref:RNA-binding S4 domain-containing protein n=1 Tax=Magnetovibrio sp. TaxID=2024836 RepID=UPI002F929601
MTGADRIRIDKWLWHARFLKSRTLAGKFCQAGKVRVNEQLITKAHVMVGLGDILTFATGTRVWVVKIKDVGTRRGPAPEAQGLYEDLSPPPPAKADQPFAPAKTAERDAGAGRPTKAERRAIDKLRELD